jgi:DNA replication protein DnaC
MDAPETMQYKRIFDRVAEMCPVSLLVDGESRRIQNAQRRKELARELLL